MEIIIYLIITLSGLYIISYTLRLIGPFFKRKPKEIQNGLHGYNAEVARQQHAEWEKEWVKKKILKTHYSKKTKKIFQFISAADSYSLHILDEKLVLLQEISLNIPKFYDGTGLPLKTFKKGEDEIIVLICGLDYYQFDLSGEKIYEKQLQKNYDETILVYHNADEFTHLYDDGSYGYVKAISIVDDTSETLDLLHEDFYSDEDSFSYEYHENIVPANKKNLFAFIAHHANYGAQGVKIYEYGRSKQLNLLYHLYDEEFEGSFHNLTFDPTGDKFIVLLYQRDKSENDYFSILEYAISDNKKPAKIITTEFGYWNFYKLYTHYITDTLFCIVRNCDLIIYDLETGALKEVIQRDLKSAYYVDFNIIIYQHNDKTIIQKYN